VPAGFVVDLWAWQRYAITHLDPHASLNMIADRVDARVLGSYAVASSAWTRSSPPASGSRRWPR